MLSREQINEIRKEFPYLSGDYKGKDYVYFDNGATVQKPKSVIESVSEYYKYENGNPHRSAHYFSNVSTEIYEGTREKVAKFIGASNPNEVVFTRNATESLNLLSYSYGLSKLKAGDEIVISIMEHHSNLVNWQFVAEKTGAKLIYLYIDDNRQIPETELSKVTDKCKVFSITAASNVVGTIPDVKKIIEKVRAKALNAFVIVDGAQYAPHHRVNVKDIGCDAFVFSGHKMYSYLGIGVLWCKEDILNDMPPFLYGGDMIEYVYEDETTFLPTPQRFEAGTQNVGGVKSLSKAIDFIEGIGIENIEEYEREITTYAYDQLSKLPFIEIYTTPLPNRTSLVSFNFKEVHPHDVSSILDSYKIAIRSGHHCAQPLHRYMGINSSCRASFAVYNTFEEVDKFVEGLYEVGRVMKCI